MADTTITPAPNGPLLVKGPVTLVDSEGTEFKVSTPTVALCRCGGSANKPFCDGSHVKIGFKADTKAGK